MGVGRKSNEYQRRWRLKKCPIIRFVYSLHMLLSRVFMMLIKKQKQK